MENRLKKRKVTRRRRVFRVRKKIRGSAEKPRLCVSKSNKNIFAQLIDDEKGLTIASASTLSKQKIKLTKESAKQVGQKIAQEAKKKKIKSVVFDRTRFKYHGLIANLADGARASGLEF